MKTKLLFIALFCSCFLAFSQQDSIVPVILEPINHSRVKKIRDMAYKKIAVKMKATINYNSLGIFKDTDSLLYQLSSFRVYLITRDFFDEFGHNYAFITSKDKEMLVFLSLESSDISEKIAVRMDAILEYLRKPTEKWQDMVSYYPPEEAKTLFNADTAFRYTIHLYPADYLRVNEREYKYIEKLFIIHKRRGLIDYTCFYTDKAKANFEKYLQPLEQILRFKKPRIK